MGVPKHHKTHAKAARRRAVAYRIEYVNLSICPNCGAKKLPHRVCPVCGYYKGKIIIDFQAIRENKEKKRLERQKSQAV